jgi:serine/threonine-protein kinase
MTTVAAEDRDRVGPYRVLKAIGAGGSARIDLARIDRAYGFQRHVVLKRPLEHLRDDPKAAASLRREARIGGRLRHPNLVSVLDAGVHDTYDYLVLEYIHGSSLRALMQADAPGQVRELPLGVALAIIVDTARGLHHAHELADEHGAPLGLVHRDVSPGNVLIGLDGTVKLADFGIAKETRVTTLSGSMHGTVTYMAPEQCRGHAFDRRADVFSLGVILYELVTGTRLFWADNDVASLHRVLSGTVPRPRKVKPALDPALEDIVLAALAPDPARRYGSAHELAGALEHFAAGAGEMLLARAIARWVEDVMGPREVPWIGSATVLEVPRGDEKSLVEIIAATGDDDPIEENFGPSDPIADPARPARVVAPKRPRNRVALASVIAVGLGGGGLGTYLALRAPGPEADVPAAAPASEPRPAPTASPDVEPTRAGPPPDEPEPEDAIELTPTTQRPAQPTKERRRRRARPTKPEPPAVVEAGSGSRPATTSNDPKSNDPKSKTKPKWDPKLLLPTDSGSAKRH